MPAAYSPVDFEPIWVALFALLQAKIPSGTFVTMSRQHTQPPGLLDQMQPALFLVDVRETYSPRPKGLPTKVTLNGYIIIYFQAPMPLLDAIGEETVVGSTMLNALLLAVRTALQPDDVMTGTLTLGGLVDHCWIEGDADKDTGIYTQQGAAIVPIKMLVP